MTTKAEGEITPELLKSEIGNTLANFGIQGEAHSRLLRGLFLTLWPAITRSNKEARIDENRLWIEKTDEDSFAIGTDNFKDRIAKLEKELK